MSLVSLADMKTYLGISDNSYDVFLTEQLNLVSDTVEAYCNRKFQADNYVEAIYSDDINSEFLKDIYLTHFPVNTITSIFEKLNETDTGVELLEYRIHKPSAKLTNTCGFFRQGRKLEVTYNAGYSVIPTIIDSVVKSVVSERYNKKVNGIDLNFGSDVQSISIPGTLSISYDYSLSNNERKNAFGNILGNNLNLLDAFRSDRAVIGSEVTRYVS